MIHRIEVPRIAPIADFSHEAQLSLISRLTRDLANTGNDTPGYIEGFVYSRTGTNDLRFVVYVDADTLLGARVIADDLIG